MKIYLWYDGIKKRYLTGKSSEVDVSIKDVLFAFDLKNRALSQKIAKNLNSIQ